MGSPFLLQDTTDFHCCKSSQFEEVVGVNTLMAFWSCCSRTLLAVAAWVGAISFEARTAFRAMQPIETSVRRINSI